MAENSGKGFNLYLATLEDGRKYLLKLPADIDYVTIEARREEMVAALFNSGTEENEARRLSETAKFKMLFRYDDWGTRQFL